jgi:hypothetical protein
MRKVDAKVAGGVKLAESSTRDSATKIQGSTPAISNKRAAGMTHKFASAPRCDGLGELLITII